MGTGSKSQTGSRYGTDHLDEEYGEGHLDREGTGSRSHRQGVGMEQITETRSTVMSRSPRQETGSHQDREHGVK